MPSYISPNGSADKATLDAMTANEKSKGNTQNALYGNYPQAAPQNPPTAGSSVQQWISNYDGIGKTDNQVSVQGTTSTAY